MDEHVIQTYKRATPVFVRGEGARLFTEDGKEYLDFLGGIAVSALGHAHPQLTEALHAQIDAVLHLSNLYRHPYTEAVAERVCRLAGMEQAFFCNSGAEANEAALKIARKYHLNQGDPRSGFVALERGFHGRTIGALSVTHKPNFRAPFEPLMPGATFVPPGDLDALLGALAEHPAALILEPIQGESGVHELPADYLQAARQACDEHGVLLIADEIQTGCGRTGSFLAIQHAGVKPDIVSLAKPIAAGLPMGMCLITERLVGTLVPGDHGSTFAGGPLCCRAALVFLESLEEGGLQQRVQELGEVFARRLDGLCAERPEFIGRRGRGLMQALQTKEGLDATVLQKQCFELGLIVNATGPDTIRLLPPFVITEADIDRCLDLLIQALDA